MADKQPAQQPDPARPRVTNYYRFFGVRPNASRDEIVEAYLARVDGADGATVERADRALAVLSDPERRSSYDQALAADAQAPAPATGTRQRAASATGAERARPAAEGGKTRLWLLAALPLLLVVVGFFLLSSQRQAGAPTDAALAASATAAQIGSDGVQTLDVLLNGDTFRYEPGVIKVKQGVPVRFNLHVKGDPG